MTRVFSKSFDIEEASSTWFVRVECGAAGQIILIIMRHSCNEIIISKLLVISYYLETVSWEQCCSSAGISIHQIEIVGEMREK